MEAEFAGLRRRRRLRVVSARVLRTFFSLRNLFLVLVVAIAVAAVVERSWVDAQLRAVAVLAVTGKIPVLAWTVRTLTDKPRYSDTEVAGVPTSIYRPGEGSQWPTIVFVNGVTKLGRHHPDVERLARALARVGFLVYVPDPPGLKEGEITPKTLAGTAAVVRAAVNRPDARNGQVALVGVSNGTTLSLLVAEKRSLARRISVVSGIAPYTDLAEMTRMATTGKYYRDGRLAPYEPEPFLGLVIARSLFANLPPSRDRDVILTKLLHMTENTAEPLTYFRKLHPGELTPSVRPVVRLLANRDPRRFDRLYAALPENLRTGVRRLSPIHEAARLRAPVFIASAPHDKYFPLFETQNLARKATSTDVSLTVTSTLHHAIPSISFSAIGSLFAFDSWMVHSLRAAWKS
jgi:pimeloyl-ACP methyl ester carboxylesterase